MKTKQPPITYNNFDTTKTYQWVGTLKNDSAKKFADQLREARLTVLHHDGAVARCQSDIEIEGTHYVSWIWLKDLKPCS